MTEHDENSTSTSSDLFADDEILPSDPRSGDGTPLQILHDREYRVRAFLEADDVILLRGAIRDQKPPGLYFEGDPDPLTIHHMQVDVKVRLPSMEILDAHVAFEQHPDESCPTIVDHYENLIGLSIARGFTHRIRELFGGPRGCTHTTALLQAMAPVAIQTLWSVAAANEQRARSGGDRPASPEAASPEAVPSEERGDAPRRSDMWRTNINSCHVWAEDGATVERILAGEEHGPPRFAQERMIELGIKPENWALRTGP